MWICGIDETGRGSLAGPLCVVAFCTQKIPKFPTKDSKKLSPLQRLSIFNQIKEWTLENRNIAGFTIVFLDNKLIDKINILNANILGFKTAIERIEKIIKERPSVIYIDGNRAPQMENYNIVPIVKADSKIKVVQIASIIAKVVRDRLMNHLSKKYPYYNFENNKGYYDKLHIDGLKRYGPSDIHRKTFIKEFLQLKLLDLHRI